MATDRSGVTELKLMQWPLAVTLISVASTDVLQEGVVNLLGAIDVVLQTATSDEDCGEELV